MQPADIIRGAGISASLYTNFTTKHTGSSKYRSEYPRKPHNLAQLEKLTSYFISHPSIVSALKGQDDRIGENFRRLTELTFITNQYKRETDNLFQKLQEFFGITNNGLSICRSIAGTYSLFFRSETQRNAVVQGAIQFNESCDGESFEVLEHQENRKKEIVENWNGYYLARRGFLIVILHNDQKLPKMYICHPLLYGKNHRLKEAKGMMLKIGGGTQKPIFSTKLLIERDDDAFAKCDIVPARQVEYLSEI